MELTIIGIDPHKRSHTAVVLDDAELIATEIRVTAEPVAVVESQARGTATDAVVECAAGACTSPRARC